MKVRILILLGIFFAVFWLTGCAINIESVKDDVISRVDPISIKDSAKFNYDVNECSNLALEAFQRYQREAFGRAVGGAILGAALGAAVGGAVGGNHHFVGHMAGAGAVGGAAGGVAGTPNWYFTVIGNCLVHRGYWLLY